MHCLMKIMWISDYVYASTKQRKIRLVNMFIRAITRILYTHTAFFSKRHRSYCYWPYADIHTEKMARSMFTLVKSLRLRSD